MKKTDLLNRFFSKIVSKESCWIWQGAKDKDGYGKWAYRSDKKVKTFRAHRWLYEQIIDKVPRNLVLDHKCRTRSCVRPSHLRIVSRKENILNNSLSIQARNKRKTHCPRGHEYSGDNLYIDPNGRRHCNKCRRIRQRK